MGVNDENGLGPHKVIAKVVHGPSLRRPALGNVCNNRKLPAQKPVADNGKLKSSQSFRKPVLSKPKIKKTQSQTVK